MHTLLINKLDLKHQCKSSLRNYSDVYILVKGNMSVNNTAAAGATSNNIDSSI